MSGGGAGGKGAAAPVPPASRKLVQSLKEIVNRPEAEIYAALRECGMDPDEAVSRLLSQDTFQEVKSKREKKKESKETPEPRSRPGNNSTSRGVRGGADRGGRNSSVHSSSADNMVPRLSASGSGLPSTNSNQKQPFASASVNKQMVADGPAVPSQASSGIQHNTWSGVPGQLSMADIVKMGRPQPKHSSKDVVAADRGYAGQYPSLTSTENQNPKQHASTVMPTEVERETPPLQDSVQVKNHHSAVDNKHTYQNDWTPQDEPTHANQSFLPETSVDPYETSLQSSSQVDDVVNSHENSHFDENNIGALRPVAASGRHSERDEGISEYNDGLLMNSNSYQLQKYPYTEGDVEVSNADVSAATVNFQNLSLHNGELTGKQIAEDNPAVIIPDHLQVTNTECAYLSFGSFESGAFSGFLPHKTTDSNVELHVREESAPTDQIDARKQDYYDNSAVTSSANINLEAMMGNTENVDGPSVSQADVLRQDVVDPSGLQYDLPSVANQTFSNTSTSQPSTMEDPQGNNQAHTLSHLSNLMGNPLSTSLLGSNQSALHDLEYSLPPYLAQKYNADPTAKPRPAVTMQEALKTGVFPDAHSTHNLPSTSIPTGPPPPQPQQLAAPGHPYSQHTVPLPFTNMIGYPYLPQNYAAYLPSIFQQAYASNGPFHQSAAAVPGSGMKYMQEYKNTLSAAGLQQQPSSAISGYGGGYGSSSDLAGNFTLNQNTGSTPSTLGFDDALSRQFKDNSQYLAHQQGDNSAMWLHGSGSRTAAGLPPNHLYAYQGQSQQGGFRQAQQPQPSQFGGHGYPNYYGSQGSLAQEQHPQNLVDGSLNGFQAAPSQPSLPSWQHQRNY